MTRTALFLILTLVVAALAAAAPQAASAAAPSIKLVSTSLKIDDERHVAVKVRCASSSTCTGTLRLQVENGSDKHPKRYRVGARRTATIVVGITPTAKRKAADRGDDAVATVTLTESDGDRSEKELPIKAGRFIG